MIGRIGRLLLLASALMPALSCAAPRAVETGVTLRADAVKAPPPPRIVFETNPPLAAVPGSRVLVVGDPGYDMFLFEGGWYLTANGYWYRASAHDGPYLSIAARAVPKEILGLPPERWKHRPPQVPVKRGIA